MEIPSALIESLRNARSVCVLTGAGVSAESGVPTLREAQSGLWSRYDPTELATQEAFAANPKLVWDWYAWRREMIAAVEPNAAHRALAEMEDIFADFVLVTQNVDGLHGRAGSGDVVELHGNISRVVCSSERIPVGRIDFVDSGTDSPPACPGCGAFLRPDVVWFGEMLPFAETTRAQEAASECEVFISVGTSSVVYPAAGLSRLAAQNGAVVVEVNPEETPLTPVVDHVLRGAAGVIIPSLVEDLKEVTG